MKLCRELLVPLIGSLLLGVASADAQETLYAATGSRGVNGVLYAVNPATGASTAVAPILAPGNLPIGITGLAFSPLDGVLYGVTGLESPNAIRSLVTINPLTGAANIIGSLTGQFGVTGLSDISFQSDGTLYGYNGSTLYTINLSSGALTTIGSTGAGGHSGSLAFSPLGTLYGASTGPSGTLDMLDPSNGMRTIGPTMTGAPQTFAMTAFAFNSAGVLYASNNSQTTPDRIVSLVTIDPVTGVVTNIGLLPVNTDAIAFSVVPEPTTALLLLSGIGVIAFLRRKL